MSIAEEILRDPCVRFDCYPNEHHLDCPNASWNQVYWGPTFAEQAKQCAQKAANAEVAVAKVAELKKRLSNVSIILADMSDLQDQIFERGKYRKLTLWERLAKYFERDGPHAESRYAVWK